MTLLVFLFPVILWLCWAAFQGHEEGVFVIAKQGNQNPNINHDYHEVWTFQRMVVGIICILPYLVYVLCGETIFFWEWLFHLILLSATLILLFPYIHDGVYFVTANTYSEDKIPYVDGWKTTKDGSAKFDFTYKQRVVMLIIGLIILVYLVIQPFWVNYSGINLRNVVLTIAGTGVVIVLVYLFWRGYLKQWFKIWFGKW